MSVRKSANCEFCFRRFLTTEDNTVCGPCDTKMQKSWDREMNLASKMHREKYKCVICKKGLSMGRRINCTDCVAPGDELGYRQLELLDRESEVDLENSHHLVLDKINKSFSRDVSIDETYTAPQRRIRRYA